MRLELADFPVTQVQLGDEFRYQSGTLVVDQEELLTLVRRQPQIRDAALGVAVPGENVRITGIRDIVEPRVKVQGGGPGLSWGFGSCGLSRGGENSSSFRHGSGGHGRV